MNIVQTTGAGSQPLSYFIPPSQNSKGVLGFCPRMEELGELLYKREVLRLIYKELKPDGADMNICLHLRDIERAAAILDRRILIAHNCLMIGVLS